MNYSAVVYEESTTVLFARVRNPNTGLYPTLATTSSVSATVLNTTTNAVVRTYSPTKTDVLSDALITNDARYDEDVYGYNVHLIVLPADVPGVGDYSVTMTITPTSGGAYAVVWSLQVRPTGAD